MALWPVTSLLNNFAKGNWTSSLSQQLTNTAASSYWLSALQAWSSRRNGVTVLFLCVGVELPWWLSGKESACQCRRARFYPWVKKIPWRRKWQPNPVFLLGKSHGQQNLAGCSPWGHRVRQDLVTKQRKQSYLKPSEEKVAQYYHSDIVQKIKPIQWLF